MGVLLSKKPLIFFNVLVIICLNFLLWQINKTIFWEHQILQILLISIKNGLQIGLKFIKVSLLISILI